MAVVNCSCVPLSMAEPLFFPAPDVTTGGSTAPMPGWNAIPLVWNVTAPEPIPIRRRPTRPSKDCRVNFKPMYRQEDDSEPVKARCANRFFVLRLERRAT